MMSPNSRRKRSLIVAMLQLMISCDLRQVMAQICSGAETKVKVEVKADRFSNDTSWELIDYYTGEQLLKQRGFKLEPNEYRSKEICLSDGLYNFTIWDDYGDGKSSPQSSFHEVIWFNGLQFSSF